MLLDGLGLLSADGGLRFGLCGGKNWYILMTNMQSVALRRSVCMAGSWGSAMSLQDLAIMRCFMIMH